MTEATPDSLRALAYYEIVKLPPRSSTSPAKVFSQAAFARLCDISPSYLSNILNGIYEYKASGDKTITIADGYFAAIAGRIGMSVVAATGVQPETLAVQSSADATLEDARGAGLQR